MRRHRGVVLLLMLAVVSHASSESTTTASSPGDPKGVSSQSSTVSVTDTQGPPNALLTTSWSVIRGRGVYDDRQTSSTTMRPPSSDLAEVGPAQLDTKRRAPLPGIAVNTTASSGGSTNSAGNKSRGSSGSATTPRPASAEDNGNTIARRVQTNEIPPLANGKDVASKGKEAGKTVEVSKTLKNATRKGINVKVAGFVPPGGWSEKNDPDAVPRSREELEEAETRSPKLDVELVHIPRTPSATGTEEPDLDELQPNDPLPVTTTRGTPTTMTVPSPPTSTSATTTGGGNSTGNGTQSEGARPRPIVPKCCPLGQRVLAELKKCVESPLEFIPPFLEFETELPAGMVEYPSGEGEAEDGDDMYYAEDSETITTEAEGYDIIVGNPCQYGRFRLEPRADSRDEFYLLPNGSLYAPFLFEAPLGPDGFCMDVFPDTTAGDTVVLPLVCFPPQPEGPRRSGLQFILYPIGLLLSVPFLLTTLGLYAMTPSLRDVHGKALICHVACLTVAYTSLATVQLWGYTLSSSLCFSIACFVQFSFVACFLWLNVMCINTWWNMSLRPATKWCRRAERRRFVLYSMYAWSLPCILMGVTLVMDLTPTIPSSYLKPRFGIDTCWFQTDRAAIPYFYGPVTALIVFNTVLFVLTAVSQHRRRKEEGRGKLSSRLHLTGSDTCYERHTVAASCFLLFGAMGINWITEVISFYVGGPYYIWYVTDTLNCLQGVTIFCIFVLNRPARREIGARLVELRARRAGREERVVEAPQVDDFRTSRVVQRQRDSREVHVSGYKWYPVPTSPEQGDGAARAN